MVDFYYNFVSWPWIDILSKELNSPSTGWSNRMHAGLPSRLLTRRGAEFTVVWLWTRSRCTISRRAESGRSVRRADGRDTEAYMYTEPERRTN